MPKATICGIPDVKVGKASTYGGGNIYPGVRELGRYAPISKPQAKQLMQKLFGHDRLPRVGYQTLLCDVPAKHWQEMSKRTYLTNTSGKLTVERHASGDFEGRRKRKKRSR